MISSVKRWNKVELVAQDQEKLEDNKKRKKRKEQINHDENSFTGQNSPPTQTRVLRNSRSVRSLADGQTFLVLGI